MQIYQIGVIIVILKLKITELRKNHGITQKELAYKVGISQSLLSYIENEKISPTINVIEKISEALDEPIERILGINDIHKKL